MRIAILCELGGLCEKLKKSIYNYLIRHGGKNYDEYIRNESL